MELQDYLLVLKKNWVVLLVATLIGGALGYTYSALATPTYAASAKVFVSTSGASSAAELQQGNTFTQQRVKTYADLVKTAAVLQPTIDALGIDTSVQRLRSNVSATAPLNTTVIDVSVTNTDPVFAASLATATANELISVVEDIETTDAAGGSPVSLTVVQEAEIPSSPASPNTTLNVALGLLLGAALGLAIALLRHALDTRIRNERDLEHVTERPVIGGIVFDPKAKERPLVLHADPRSPRAESFRTLRTNLQFLDAGKRHRSFVLTSALPSEGKSTTASNLAIALADAGARVLLVGADLRKPKMANYMGVEGGVGLTDVLVGRAALEDATQRWGRTSLHLLPAGTIPPNPSELLGSTTMSDLIEDLQQQYDVVLYDAPPLLPVTDAAVLARLVGGSILIVSAGRTRRQQVEAALDSLDNVGAPLSGLVLTMLPVKGPDAYGYGRYGYAYAETASKK
ncbi:polysaccharide biosynthesis tyrosine autokinase [Demequina sp. NBRC 110056]|uniref:polysaccharide biosynthesis tyrosine autokinase n=1 Tax=Demequina sp. NBRC 110056 TaxID=1570345 RepID=UPI0009FC07DC|nr:polysaccharide biosynthesis tyrosine autokinase [Demequina sp. NBRC 110056]